MTPIAADVRTRSKAERLSVGKLLVEQRAAKHRIERAYRDTVGGGAITVLAALALARKLTVAGAEAIYESRESARKSARRRLLRELGALGFTLPASALVFRNRASIDRVAAERAARSLATQYRGVIATEVQASESERVRTSIARQGMIFRMARTAHTEVARAYSEEHDKVLRDVVEHDRKFRDGEFAEAVSRKVGKRWSALADACELCAPLDGEVVGLDEDFSSGSPGGMHPNCRCTAVLVDL